MVWSNWFSHQQSHNVKNWWDQTNDLILWIRYAETFKNCLIKIIDSVSLETPIKLNQLVWSHIWDRKKKTITHLVFYIWFFSFLKIKYWNLPTDSKKIKNRYERKLTAFPKKEHSRNLFFNPSPFSEVISITCLFRKNQWPYATYKKEKRTICYLLLTVGYSSW